MKNIFSNNKNNIQITNDAIIEKELFKEGNKKKNKRNNSFTLRFNKTMISHKSNINKIFINQNQKTRNVKKLKEKNNTNEFKSKYNTSRNDEKNENISLSKINNNFIQIKNDKKKEIKKIIFKNKPNNNSIREGYKYK